ncbi:DUF1212-domain-containing protein [Nadsonia fulvescens var. elongata DSM 6958]|uniref:DUF1212-domain-containing protein n=1 Tax=Nadsonia fulvescens var. elongata DSM 6958 TaxID=857566 RepID=A0A1E3PD99_9ASCO|nr:DUF1212-domain-containing protein [Nadsonia fulvescens var. elongata DSM 6958]
MSPASPNKKASPTNDTSASGISSSTSLSALVPGRYSDSYFDHSQQTKPETLSDSPSTGNLSNRVQDNDDGNPFADPPNKYLHELNPVIGTVKITKESGNIDEGHFGFSPNNGSGSESVVNILKSGDRAVPTDANNNGKVEPVDSLVDTPTDLPLRGPYDRGHSNNDIPMNDLTERLSKVVSNNELPKAMVNNPLEGSADPHTRTKIEISVDDPAGFQDLAQHLVDTHTKKFEIVVDDGQQADPFSVPNVDYFSRPHHSTPHQSYLAQSDPNVPTETSDSSVTLANSSASLSSEIYNDGMRTPMHEDYIPPPKHVKQGVLGSLLKLYGDDHTDTHPNSDANSTINSEPSTPGPETSLLPAPQKRPKFGKSNSFNTILSQDYKCDDTDQAISGRNRTKWYEHASHKRTASNNTLANLVFTSASTLVPQIGNLNANFELGPVPSKSKKPKLPKKLPGKNILKNKHKHKLEEAKRITIHIADLLQRQRFILKLCKSLMIYGAPTHRLEEYMVMTSRVLEIDGQYIYIPGCMIASFGDTTTHTSEMQLVRCQQGLNLSKLNDTHTIYKEVIHDMIGVAEASSRIDKLLSAPNLYPPWLCVLIFGFSSAMVAPFGFGGVWLDMPMAFILGSIVGFLQIFVAPKSDLYSNVFEVTASIVVSFLSRAFGSIQNGKLFCYAAMAQGSLALILPGYIILCGALELQSKNIVGGSVRMFYAIVYSLFLGFGITLGAAIYGWIDVNATSVTVCEKSLSPWYRFIFVPAFSVGLALVNQARIVQLPAMVFISSAGYSATYFVGQHTSHSAELTSAVGAFVIGILGNLYSRIGHGLAFAAMLPAIFVQVPSGIASQNSIIAGIQNANIIVQHNATIVNGTTTVTTSNSDSSSGGDVLSLGVGMMKVSIGITVGLFAATLAVYPLGKKRSGLFRLKLEFYDGHYF